MSIFQPEAVKVQGNDKITLCTTIANPASPSLATEIDAASSVEITLAAYGQWTTPVQVNTGNAPARMGTTVQLPEEGNAQRQVVPLAYPVDPSKPDTDPANKVKALLAQGTELYAVVRRGIDHATAFASGDAVQVWKVRAGYQPEPSATGTDEYSEYQIQQNLIPLSEAPTMGTVAA